MVVVNVTYSNAGSDPDEIDVQLITWAYTQGGRDGVAGPAAGNPGVYVASRNASRSSSIPQLTAAGARAVTSSVALRINGATAAVAEPLHQHAGVGRPRPPPPPPSRATTAATFKIKAGCTVSIVAAVADNVVEGNAHNPANEAVAAAVGANPGTVALAASAWWAKFYSKSSVTLPSSPVVEAYWYGSQYIAAAMSASTTVLQNNEGLLPPSGLYGPWVSSDSPSWNGDFTLDYNQEAGRPPPLSNRESARGYRRGTPTPSVFSRDCSLRPFSYADTRYIDAVIAIEGSVLRGLQLKPRRARRTLLPTDHGLDGCCARHGPAACRRWQHYVPAARAPLLLSPRAVGLPVSRYKYLHALERCVFYSNAYWPIVTPTPSLWCVGRGAPLPYPTHADLTCTLLLCTHVDLWSA